MGMLTVGLRPRLENAGPSGPRAGRDGVRRLSEAVESPRTALEGRHTVSAIRRRRSAAANARLRGGAAGETLGCEDSRARWPARRLGCRAC